MSFFDNWRVHFASICALSENESRLQDLEDEYHSANTERQQEIFDEYTNSVNRSQSTLAITNTITTGAMFSILWTMSCEQYPELAAITDDNTRHAILACPTKEAQDRVLSEYLKGSISE